MLAFAYFLPHSDFVQKDSIVPANYAMRQANVIY